MMRMTWKRSERERESGGAWCVCVLLWNCAASGSTEEGLREAKKHTIYREIQKFQPPKRSKHTG